VGGNRKPDSFNFVRSAAMTTHDLPPRPWTKSPHIDPDRIPSCERGHSDVRDAVGEYVADGLRDNVADLLIWASEHAGERDESPITEDWLRSVGFVDHATAFYIHANERQILHAYRNTVAARWNWSFGTKELLPLLPNHPQTRSQVRRLADSLGITLKEGTNE
jgi:hypothetical protein